MKIYLLLPFVLLFVACGEPEKSASGEDGGETAAVERKKACEVISLEEVSEIMGWDAASYTMKPIDFGGEKEAACLISGDSTMIIALAYEKKHLDEIFANYLKNGSGKLTYEEVDAGESSQAILGTGAVARGEQSYNLRKRYEDDRELYIDLSSANANKEEVLEKLQRLAVKLEG